MLSRFVKLCLVLWQTVSFAETVLYPGSFNPFHRTHFEEVENVLSLDPKAQVTLLPIEEASYTKDAEGEPLRVRLFSFPLEVSLISKAFEGNTKVRVSEDLRVISGDPVESLLTYSQKLSDPDVSILVGPDVVEKWVRSPKFDALLKRVKLLVTKDPKNPALGASIQSQFQENDRLIFISLPTSGIRGGEVRSSIISRSDHLYDLVSPALGNYFKKNPEVIEAAIGDYRKRLLSYLEKDLQRSLLPKLIENGLPAHAGAFFMSHLSLALPLVAIKPDDVASIAEAAEKLRSHLPHALREEARTLISDLVVAATRPPVYELLQSRSDTTERILFRTLENSSSPPQRSSAVRSHSVFSDPFGTWNESLTSIMRPFTQLELSDPPEIKALSQKEKPGYLEVYRGIKDREGIDDLVQKILESGFVSKVALKSLKEGALDGGLSASEHDLFKRGLQSAILEHVFGDYHNTSPFVATTLSKEIAEAFAGKDGFVFKIRTPIREGHFLNDLVYWKNTPWEEEGNPFRHLNEFIIPHKISAEQILEARKVTEVPSPLPTVSFIQRAKTLQLVPFKLKTSVQKTTRQVCSQLFQSLVNG